jgi:hypothetical protein
MPRILNCFFLSEDSALELPEPPQSWPFSASHTSPPTASVIVAVFFLLHSVCMEEAEVATLT